jgi:hypothetical protein
MVPIAARPGAPIIDINVTLNRFSQITLGSWSGLFFEGLSSELLPLSACCFHVTAKSTE